MQSTIFSSGGSDDQPQYLNDPELRKLFDETELEELQGVFKIFDIDGDETISVTELSKIMQTLG